MKTTNTDPVKKLLKTLNSLAEIETTYKTLYEASNNLLNKYPDSTIFEFISILSYNKEKALLVKLNGIFLGNFYQEVSEFKYNAFKFFIYCIQNKNHLDNQYITQKILDLIGQINSNSFILKYIKMIDPLIKDKTKIYQTKIKLLVMIPNNFKKLHLEMSKEFPLFPDSITDFYSYNKIKNNSDTFLKFAKEKKNTINIDDNAESLKNELNAIKNIVTHLQKENTDIKNNVTLLQKENADFKLNISNLQADNKILFEKSDKLKAKLYQINFRDSIKSFLDKLMESLNLFIYNLSLSMKIEEITTKINNLSSELNEDEKKCACILINILDHLKSANKTGDDFSHFFNNLGFDIDNLPKKVKDKYLIYTNGN